jgi:quinol-cytochrome oxidoreductase complex cytochrome b subunit
MTEHSPGFVRRLWLSIFSEPIVPRTERDRKRFPLRYLILHLRPATVSEETLRFTLSWGLGGMALVLVVLQLATGILLKYAYEPVPTLAYASILRIQHEVLFGQFIRNIHHWSANVLVLVIFLHLLRVFFTGAFHPPRQFNWVIGLCLLVLVLVSNFTGYLLPWDQLAYWGTTICIGMLEYIPGVGTWLQNMIRGGTEIGTDTLRIFFATHTAVLPLLIVTLIAFHSWRVRKAGGLVRKPADQGEASPEPGRVSTMPNLLLREVTVALALIAAVFVLSAVLDAPLGNPANPGLSPNPTKAPWYFAGIQEMLLHFHPSFAIFVIPFLFLGGFLLLPYVPYGATTGGIWFSTPRGGHTAAVAAAAASIVTPVVILLDEYFIDLPAWFPGLPLAVANGLIPALALFAVVAGLYLLMVRAFSASRLEGVQAVFVFLAVSFVFLTVTCVWFRGQGMELVWPFQGTPLG